MPYGRGGAGNIAMQEQVKKQNEKISEVRHLSPSY
jgi:hypothetical protein